MEELIQELRELAPEAIEQMLGWGIFANVVGLIVAALVIVAFLMACVLARKQQWFDKYDGDIDVAAAFVIGGVICSFAAVIVICCMVDLWKIRVYPMVYIIDKLT